MKKPSQKPKQHVQHLCKRGRVVELHNRHIVIRERLRCTFEGCGYYRDPHVEIFSLSGIVDKRTRDVVEDSREALEGLLDEEKQQ